MRAGAAYHAEWTSERQQEMAARLPPLPDTGQELLLSGQRGSFLASTRGGTAGNPSSAARIYSFAAEDFFILSS
ncbi:hypothetical protein A4244_16420 [Bacillus badius]|uniref:Uncharacterized protein n=1 Tax=Bacillus badius TaxID=1455 RepID=A0ABR5AWN9_BACBA|nr:hypothetical protein SD78_1334 [Bacillus badius]KIL79145.1 hypothetical protein SD77_3565 [Bacillus badius]KZN99590.1 hypothetical protein A4244_16420 [Bacillus badius]KZR57962.1 hypothetical protein A3781_18785 [Bacillus badius]OCS85694.1 hypothetical protein A6M11_16435 [Bacillus badius]